MLETAGLLPPTAHCQFWWLWQILTLHPHPNLHLESCKHQSLPLDHFLCEGCCFVVLQNHSWPSLLPHAASSFSKSTEWSQLHRADETAVTTVDFHCKQPNRINQSMMTSLNLRSYQFVKTTFTQLDKQWVISSEQSWQQTAAAAVTIEGFLWESSQVRASRAWLNQALVHFTSDYRFPFTCSPIEHFLTKLILHF